jgi:TonB family protein
VSFGVHVVIVALIAWFVYMAHLHIQEIKKAEVATVTDIKPFVPIAPAAQKMGGGGGGGSHDILQTPKGKLPKFEKDPITPPMVIKNINPKLAVDPAINMPKDIVIPNNNLPDLGNPKSSIVGPQSNGTGSGGGMGTGSNGGVGSGKGNGFGPGSGGLTGGGAMHVGGGVSAPRLIFSVDPEFSDEARRAKYQGVSVLSIIVDAQGNVQRARVLRPLGMGLDEKALEAVKQYRFQPATYQGKSVPVEVNIEINFRIY